MRLWHWGWTCAEHREDRLALEDQVRELESQVSELRQQLADSRLETLRASEKVTDWLAKRFVGMSIFGNSSEGLPASEAPVSKPRVQARELVRQLTVNAEQELQNWTASQAKGANGNG